MLFIIVIACGCPEVTAIGIMSTRFLITLDYLQFVIFIVIPYRPSNTNQAKCHDYCKTSYLLKSESYLQSDKWMLDSVSQYCLIPDKSGLCLSWTKTYGIFPVVFTSFSSWKFWQLTYIVIDYRVPHYIFGKCWTMPITACTSELRGIFHLMLTFFMFYLISYIPVNVQVLAGTEIITRLFIGVTRF